jgi:hypothetical protein
MPFGRQGVNTLDQANSFNFLSMVMTGFNDRFELYAFGPLWSSVVIQNVAIFCLEYSADFIWHLSTPWSFRIYSLILREYVLFTTDKDNNRVEN